MQRVVSTLCLITALLIGAMPFVASNPTVSQRRQIDRSEIVVNLGAFFDLKKCLRTPACKTLLDAPYTGRAIPKSIWKQAPPILDRG